jgi:hypothetical protein
MQKINASYSHKIIVLTITITIISLIAYCVFSLWSIHHWQESVLNKTALSKVEPPLEKLISTEKKMEQSLVLSNIDLPAPPQLTLQSKSLNPAGERAKSVNTIKHSVKPISKTVVQAADQNTSIKQQTPSTNQFNKATMKDVSSIYQQLISDNSIDIELAWPNQKTERKDIFNFLYQCVGMRFGVLNNQKVFLAETNSPPTNPHKKQQSSQWLRIAQGQLTNQERHWLQQYNLAGTPVRLFPKVVDWQLSILINKQLNSEPLKSVRAHYKYNNRRLMLTNITLNDRRIDNDWQLIEKECLPSA